MVKKYVEGETKEERKARKQKEKAFRKRPTPPSVPIGHKPKFIACLKFGDKYDADYVNKLYAQAKRHCTLDFEFVCFTEDAKGLHKGIRVEDLPQIPLLHGATGWWWKPMFFDKKLPIRGTILYFDLDVIIFRNIDHLFTHKPGEFLICRDFNRFQIKNYPKFNSSVFRLDSGQHSHVWTDFIRNPATAIRKHHGDQDWIREQIRKDFDYWPDIWIQSYKWEMRGKPKMEGVRGKRDFVSPGDPRIHKDTSVAVFHGEPNPHYCKDKWVRDNWQ